MIKILCFFRFFINPIIQSNFFNNKKILKKIKYFYDKLINSRSIDKVDKNIVEIDILIREILIKYDGYLGCGNALFLARGEQNFIGQDIDYCFQGITIENYKELVVEMAKLNFKLINKLYCGDLLIEIKFKYKKSIIDFFILEKENDHMNEYAIFLYNKFPILNKINNEYCLTNNICLLKKWPIVNLKKELKMHNHKFLVPDNLDEYLSKHYGNDWLIENINFDHFTMPKDNKPLIIYDIGKIVYI